MHQGLAAASKLTAAVLCAVAAAFLLSSPPGSRALGAAAYDGEDIFRARCSICHGVDGAGKTARGKKLKVPDLRSSEVQELSDEELAETVSDGKGEMPAFGKKLGPEKIQQVVSYLRQLRR